MIFTASNQNCKGNNTISIKECDKFISNNIKSINIKEYIQNYYQNILAKLDPYEVSMDLEGKILVCDNSSIDRYIISAWLELLIGINVPDVKHNINKQYTCLPKSIYIKDMLEEVIKENTDMNGFTSLRALYIFNKSVELENMYKKPLDTDSREFDDYTEVILSICDMRETAKRIEIKNKENNKSKVKRY